MFIFSANMKYTTFSLLSIFLLVLTPSNAVEMEVNPTGDSKNKDQNPFNVYFALAYLTYRVNIITVKLHIKLLM